MSDGILKQSRDESQEGFQFQLKKARTRQFTERRDKSGLLAGDDDEYDISDLIDLLYEISFTDKDIHNSIERSLSGEINRPINCSEMFKFAKSSNNRSETEIKDQEDYFDKSTKLIQTDSWNDSCMIHNEFNLRGMVLNELLMTLSHLVQNDKDENHLTGLMLIPNDTIIRIIRYLKVLCSDSEEYEKPEESYFANFFRMEVKVMKEQKEKLFQLEDFKMTTGDRAEVKEENKQEIKVTVLSEEEDPKEEEEWCDCTPEAQDYFEIVNSLWNFDVFGKDPWSDLFHIIKSVKQQTFKDISLKINPDHVINKIVHKISREQKRNYQRSIFGKFLS